MQKLLFLASCEKQPVSHLTVWFTRHILCEKLINKEDNGYISKVDYGQCQSWNYLFHRREKYSNKFSNTEEATPRIYLPVKKLQIKPADVSIHTCSHILDVLK